MQRTMIARHAPDGQSRSAGFLSLAPECVSQPIFGGAYNYGNPFSDRPGFRPESAFAEAAGRFFELLKAFGLPRRAPRRPGLVAPGGAACRTVRAVAAHVAVGAGRWFSAPGAALCRGPRPDSPRRLAVWTAAAGSCGRRDARAQRTLELAARLAQLQTQLATHWGEIAQQRRAALRRARRRAPRRRPRPRTGAEAVRAVGELRGGSLRGDRARGRTSPACRRSSPTPPRRSWSSSAATPRVVARAFGLPTRSEVDALYAHCKELRRSLVELAAAADSRRRKRSARPRRAEDRKAPAPGEGLRARGGARSRVECRPAAGRAEYSRSSTLRVTQTLSRVCSRRARCSVGCSPKRAVWSCGKTTLYEYLPLAPSGARAAHRRRPHLLRARQPPLRARSAARSLAGAAAARGGPPVYLIDWGDPDEADRRIDLEDYIEQHLGGCVRHVLGRSGSDALNLLGVCQGGVLSLCYTALHAAAVARLITLTTPVDFPHPGQSAVPHGYAASILSSSRRCGNVPGEVLNALFLALMPFG